MDTNSEQQQLTREPSRSWWNFWVDLLTGLVFSAMLGTGILEKWFLLPGSRGGGGGHLWLGLGRHEWGDIHFWLGVSMLALVVVHIWLHWGWVLHTWQRFIGSLRNPVTWLAILLMAALILLPVIIPVQFSEEAKLEHDALEEAFEQQNAEPEPGVAADIELDPTKLTPQAE